jgi:hypothetical protein
VEHIMPGEKQRRRGEAAARQPATPTKRRKVARVAATRTNCSCTARPDVRTYLERYRSGGEKQVMASLRSLAAGELETELESCERLRDFIRAYGVPRTFKGMREDNVLPLAPVVRHLQHRWAELQSLPHGDDSTAIIREVDALADVCKAAGFARNTSFASKALNMLGVPLPLFSSECLAYLRLPRTASYALFQALAWAAAYEDVDHRSAYEAASKRQLEESDGEEAPLGMGWLAMRGFGVRLLLVGGPMRK